MTLFLDIPLRAVVLDKILHRFNRLTKSGDEVLVARRVIGQLGVDPRQQLGLNEVSCAHGRDHSATPAGRNTAYCWAAKWTSGGKSHLLRRECVPVLFRTRRECRAWIRKHYGYIAARKDLRDAPHHWRIPRAVRVKVQEV